MPKLLVIIFIFYFQFANSQIRVYSNEFLSIGVGARALSMSNSVIASTNGSESSYWNPSSLVFQESKYEVSGMHSEYFAGIAKFDYLGGSFKVNDSSTIGATILRFGIDNIPNTLDLIDANGNIDYDRIKHFSVADYAFILSYAKKSKIKGLSYGANAKIIYRNLAEFANAFGFGFDISANYKKGKWQYGANFKDVTSTFNAWFYNTENLENVYITTGNEIPKNSIEITIPKLLLGIAKDFKINDKYNLLTEIGTDISFDGKKHVLLSSKFASIDPHLGLELNYKNFVFLRAGVGNFAIIKDFDKENLNLQPSIGLGINILNFKLNYALTDVGDQSIALYSNIFSLSYSFNKISK
jgi:hypothetical protein